MILLHVEKETDHRARVGGCWYDLTGLDQEFIESGILVESIPKESYQVGKIGILYINPKTKEMWYEYVDRSLTPEEEIAQLKERMHAMQVAIDSVLGV